MIDQQLRRHYRRVYNARPSPEIARTRLLAGSAASVRSVRHYGHAQTAGSLNRKKSSSNVELSAAAGEGVYWTQRYLNDDNNFRQRYHPFSSDDERHASSSFLDSQRLFSGSAKMKSPSVSNLAVAGKIDRFLDVVEQCEVELREEYEARKRSVDSRRRLPWHRSVSSVSNLTQSDSPITTNVGGGGGGAHNKKTLSSYLSTFQDISEVSSRTNKRKSLTATARIYAKPLLTHISPVDVRRRPPSVAAATATTATTPTTWTRKKKTPNKPMSSRRPPSSSSTTAKSQVPKPLKAFNRVVESDYGLPDTSKVQSKLKEDRLNYQPPRRKRLVKKVAKKKVNNQSNNTSKSSSNDYEEDFEANIEGVDVDHGVAAASGVVVADNGAEADEEEEEEEGRDIMLTRQWINDQAARGITRQKALQGNGNSSSNYYHPFDEKESSKDSAYGYSGGESRLATREPTPEYRLRGNTGSKGRPPSLSAANAFKTSRELLDSEDEKSSAYVGYVTRVTDDILKRGVFTDRALREALERQMKSHDGITTKDVGILTAKLKKELGISSGLQSLSASMSEANLKDLLAARKQVKSSTTKVQVTLLEEGSVKDLPDQEARKILYEADLDDDTIKEVMRNVQQQGEHDQSPPSSPHHHNRLRPSSGQDSLQIFDSLNISNLNISFNAAAAANDSKKKEKRDQQRALLIKSFAKNRCQNRPQSAVTSSTSRRRPGSSTLTRPSSSSRQDSSSSNPDYVVTAAAVAKTVAAKPDVVVTKKYSQLPDTPAHSSETPRSSLYQPESEKDEEPEEIRDDHDDEEEDKYDDSEFEEDIDEEISTD